MAYGSKHRYAMNVKDWSKVQEIAAPRFSSVALLQDPAGGSPQAGELHGFHLLFHFFIIQEIRRFRKPLSVRHC